MMHKNRLSLFMLLAAAFIFTLTAYAPRARAAGCCSCLTTQTVGLTASWGLHVLAPALAKVEAKIGKLSNMVYVPGGVSTPMPPPINNMTGPAGHRDWMEKVVWGGKDPATAQVNASLLPIGLQPALEAMGKQLASVAMQQTMMFGMFMDAEQQIETQQTLQTLQARAHKDYHFSVGMCEIGSNVRSLAASEKKSEITATSLDARATARAMGNANAIGTEALDKQTRLAQFRTVFCDPADHNNGLDYMCQHNPTDGEITKNEKIGGENPDRFNKDIDFIRTVDSPLTLNTDFSDDILTHHEEEVLAMASNLYSHNVLPGLPAKDIENNINNPLTATQENYMDLRALRAKQTVAENSFNAITALKSEGAPGAKEFVTAVMAQVLNGPEAAQNAALILGDDIDDPLAPDVEPSYHAQMEILAKKLLQTPDFYTNLYEQPANVGRKNTALQAIGLMQKFDLFKSHLRNEANLSILLELAVMRMQQRIENEINAQSYSSAPPSGGGLLDSLPDLP